MTIGDRTVFRTVVVGSPATEPGLTPATRLLNQLGHDVRQATPATAGRVLGAAPADLLVLDLMGTAIAEHAPVAAMAADACGGDRVRQVAVFADQIDASLQSLRNRLPERVHVFLKPLHMHGLLNVLRHLERDSAVAG